MPEVDALKIGEHSTEEIYRLLQIFSSYILQPVNAQRLSSVKFALPFIALKFLF